ncbi:MAG: hypothetical protein CMI89_00235 [Pelagibacteraceae bacterium]|nr:hypothetical protein [Pelagibacteraceae bacterium]
MYKVIYDTIASTQNEIINFDRYKKVLNNNNLYVQSLEQEKGTGRGKRERSNAYHRFSTCHAN